MLTLTADRGRVDHFPILPLFTEQAGETHRNTVRNAHEPSVRSGLAFATSGSHTGHGPLLGPGTGEATPAASQSAVTPLPLGSNLEAIPAFFFLREK